MRNLKLIGTWLLGSAAFNFAVFFLLFGPNGSENRVSLSLYFFLSALISPSYFPSFLLSVFPSLLQPPLTPTKPQRTGYVSFWGLSSPNPKTKKINKRKRSRKSFRIGASFWYEERKRDKELEVFRRKRTKSQQGRSKWQGQEEGKIPFWELGEIWGLREG